MKRLRYIDQAKGLGILCITFLHYENGVMSPLLNAFIGNFMIGIFYIIAGWVLAMKDTAMNTKELAKRRLKSLGLPYLYWSVLIIVFDCLLWAFGYYDSYFIEREVYKTIVLRGIGTLWFLPALFCGEICWNWLRKKNWIVIILMLALTAIYLYFYDSFFANRTTIFWKQIQAPFFTISNAVMALWIVMVGYYGYKIVNRIGLFGQPKYWIGLIGLAIIIIAWIGCQFNWLHSYWWRVDPLIAPLGFLLLLYGIERWRILNYFDFWGRNSLSLMVTHYSFVQVLIVIFITKVLNMEFDGWITIYAFIASMPIQYLITIIVNKKAAWLVKPKGFLK